MRAMRIAKVSSLLFLLLTAVLSSPLFGRDTLTPSRPLADDGTTLISAGSNFHLGFFSPPLSTYRYVGIWYHKVPLQTVVWVANRKQPLTDSSGRLSITTNGTLLITDDNSTVFWSSASPALASPVVARLLDTGNFVVTEVDGGGGSDTFAWESFRFPTDSLLPGLKVGWKSGQVINLTSWRSTSDPSPGDFVASCDMHGDPQLFIWFGSQKYYRGGPWNGVTLSGMPDMKYSEMVQYEAVVSPDQVVFYFNSTNPSIISRFVLTPAGTLQHVGWIEGEESWKIFGYSPKDQCDPMSQCGPNGVCYALLEMMCTCMPGFRPRNGTKWDGRDWSDGCSRKTQLDCHNGTDGFVKQTNLKLPDTSTSMVNMSMNLQQCRALCLANCSCTAYASADISGSGSGCIIWTSELTDVRSYDNDLGQDLYLRLAAADLVGMGRKHSLVRVIILVPIILTICLLACAAYLWKKNKKSTDRCRADEEKEVKHLDLPLFDLSTIVDATGNFSAENKLGQGGFGPVYKGKVGEEEEIAIKRLSKTSGQGVDEFKNEVVLIAKLQHRNLIRLLGCCIQGGERMLVYEYMPNGSLDTILFDEVKRVLLDWPTRYNIIVGIAEGLLYLHQYSRFRIIHRDLKASNILLDNEMNPKISDFGMARIFREEDSEINTRKIVGTYGYMAPEYAMDGIFSIKSDVFSFGVLVLEIITSIRNRGLYHCAPHINLLGHVWSLWKEGKALEIIDRSIEHSVSTANVFSCIKVGLLCVQERPKDRPTMSSVIKMLGNEAALLPEPMQPGFITTKSPSIQVDSSSNKEFLSENNVTITVLDGR